MTNVAVLTNAYREENWIVGCIEQFKPFNLYHLVLESLQSWAKASWDRDATGSISRSLGAEVISHNWGSEADQFNYAMAYLRDYDWVIICDADERYDESNLEALLDHLENVAAENISGIKTCRWNVYWKTSDYEIEPQQTDFPLIAVRPQHVMFQKARDPGPIAYEFVYSRMYHFSYVRTDEEMWKKICTFSHAFDFNKSEWYQDKWLAWTPEMEDLHPVAPEQFKRAVYRPAPERIKRLIPDEDFSHNSAYA